MRNYGIRQMRSVVTRAYACNGEDCGYIFELSDSRRSSGTGFAEACKRFYSAFYAMRGEGVR